MSYIHCSTKLYDFGWCHDIFHPHNFPFADPERESSPFAWPGQWSSGSNYLFLMQNLIDYADIRITTWLTGVCNFLGSWELNSRKLPQVYFASKLPTFKFLLVYHLHFLECCELPRIAFHQDRGEIKRNKLLLKLLLRTNLNLIFRNFVMRR